MEVLRAIRCGEPSGLFLQVGEKMREEAGLATSRHKAPGNSPSRGGRNPGLSILSGPLSLAISLRWKWAGDVSRVTWVGRQK